MSKVLLTDSCFWIGLLDPADSLHNKANEVADFLETNVILIPWPSMYEVICTRLTRRRDQMMAMEEILHRSNSRLFDDVPYRDTALAETFNANRTKGSSHSLVDAVIRQIVLDDTVKVDYLITFNDADFADVCAQRRITIFN